MKRRRPTTCDAGFRWSHTVIRCELDAGHGPQHEGKRGQTIFTWDDSDRRTFHGDDPGKCAVRGTGVGGLPVNLCVLPLGHRSDHAF